MGTCILLIIFCGSLYFVIHKYLFPYYMSSQGKEFLYQKLFLHQENMRKEVVDTFHAITANRFSEEEAIDYFMKEKGLQLMSITPGTPLKLKYFLALPTKVELTFFEKVKFNEAFLSYRADNIKGE